MLNSLPVVWDYFQTDSLQLHARMRLFFTCSKVAGTRWDSGGVTTVLEAFAISQRANFQNGDIAHEPKTGTSMKTCSLSHINHDLLPSKGRSSSDLMLSFLLIAGRGSITRAIISLMQQIIHLQQWLSIMCHSKPYGLNMFHLPDWSISLINTRAIRAEKSMESFREHKACVLLHMRW